MKVTFWRIKKNCDMYLGVVKKNAFYGMLRVYSCSIDDSGVRHFNRESTIVRLSMSSLYRLLDEFEYDSVIDVTPVIFESNF